MTTRSDGQSWILNTLLAASGYEVLHPESKHFMAEIGYDPVDFDRVLTGVQTGAQLPKAFGRVGAEIEKKAEWYAEQGLRRASRDLYLRASLLYGQASYSYAPGDSRRDNFRVATNRATEQVIKLSAQRIERLEIEFEGKTLYALAHFPQQTTGPVPLVLMLPGMDMYKEDWTKVAEEYYLPRGIAVLGVDGPGQGESFGHGLTVTLNNYERAISTFIDVMSAREDIDSDKIGLWGVSMGSYWGLRSTAADDRIKAVATAMGCYGDMSTIFGKAQPGFKANFMRMSGYTDEAAFDNEIAAQMSVAAVIDNISVPVLMAYGEFDELSTLEETIELFDKVTSPKRLMVFEQEFHALGGVGAELIGSASDWLIEALVGEGIEGKNQAYIGRDGKIDSISGTPPWWSAAAADRS
ncbi:UNVERIFIED_ORG: pimeloyl-ACP methyl ester carboxylesterase [Paenarthrobacter nicotinovorans]